MTFTLPLSSLVILLFGGVIILGSLLWDLYSYLAYRRRFGAIYKRIVR